MEDNEYLSEADLGETNDKLLVWDTINKLKSILWKLLEPDFEIKNDIYLNLLLTQWINKTENGVKRSSLNRESNELFLQWLVMATNLWNEKKITPSTPILIFSLRVCCQLNKDETFFIRLYRNNVFYKLAEISQADQGSSTDVTVGFINVLSSILEYAEGVEWLVITTYWNYVIDIALKDCPKYTKRKAYQFTIKLLETTVLLEQEFCEEVVAMLLEPFNEATAYVESTKESEVTNTKMYESLKPSLELVTEIGNSLLKSFNKNVLNFFIDMEISEVIQNILNFSQSQVFSFDLLKVRLIFLFYQMYVKLEKMQQITHDEETLADIKVIFDLIRTEVEKDHVNCVIKICHYAQSIYHSLNTHTPLCIRKGESIEFQNQMMLIQLVPFMAFSQQLVGTKYAKGLVWADDLRRDYYLKFSKISAIKTLEITSRWQLRLVPKQDLVDDLSMCCQYILKSKKIINREQAAFILKPLIYTLKDVKWRLKDYTEKNMKSRGVKLLSIITDTIIDLVESFDLTWTDSIETIYMLDLVCEIVQHEYVDYQITTKFLQLLKMAISRCMSPNMVLLMDHSTDSAISQVGTILHSKCHNKHPQVRTTGLEVIRVLALDACAKFPNFKNILFNADLSSLVIKMALNDKEHTVRATGIKCLQALILVEDIWEVYQSNDNFLDNILNIFIREPNSTVRKETAILVYDIYKIYNFPETILPRLYDIMTHASIGDINWEVKCIALRFWACTLRNHLRAEGMIDRGFPTHTFSKEKKKIITLTEDETRKRVIKVLYELSEIGCLYVMKTALHDEFDEEVSKYAMVILNDVVRMIKHHKITCDNVARYQPPVSPSSSSQRSSSSSWSDSSSSASMDSPPMQYPNSPGSSHSSFSPAPATREDISPEHSASEKPNKQNDLVHDNQTSTSAEEDFEKFDLLTDACLETDILMVESNIDMGVVLAENDLGNSMEGTEKMFDELLKLNDSTLLEQIYNPGYQVNTTPKHKSKEYLSPSEFVKFCIEVFESNERRSSNKVQHTDEFDLLLEDVVKEYHVTALK